jgi:YD repeat-containing protein
MRRLLHRIGSAIHAPRRFFVLLSVIVALFAAHPAFAQSVTYTYDNAGRLTQATYSNGASVQYTYDASGNRTQVAQTGVVQSPIAVDDYVTTPSGTPVTYDPRVNDSDPQSYALTITGTSTPGHGSVTINSGTSLTYTPTSGYSGSDSFTYTISNGHGGTATATDHITITSSTFTATIAITGSGPVNLRTLANSAGYNGAQNATVTYTLASGVTITGSAGAPNGGSAIDTGTWPTGSYTISLTLQVTGNVYGGGGKGGKGAGNAGAAGAAGNGGDAIYCQAPISITVNSGGQVKAGGGGGGGGGGWITPLDYLGGGGGGGGFANGPGGAKGDSDADLAQNGSAGTASGGGAGGNGEPLLSGHAGGAGGAGGGAAGTGTTGSTGSGRTGSGYVLENASAGGSPGYAIRKNGNTVPVTNNGTITGTQG